MKPQRTDRLNSILREVISQVLQRDVKNPDIHPLTTISRVDITRDLQYAKVYVSVIGSAEERKYTVTALNKAAGFIGVTASKKVTIRHFPSLTFMADDTVDKLQTIEKAITEIQEERDARD